MTFRFNIIGTTLVLLSLAACSNKQLYEIGKNKQKQACLEERGERYQKCMEQPQQTFEDYQEVREGIINGKEK